jgi:hypothetical protein
MISSHQETKELEDELREEGPNVTERRQELGNPESRNKECRRHADERWEVCKVDEKWTCRRWEMRTLSWRPTPKKWARPEREAVRMKTKNTRGFYPKTDPRLVSAWGEELLLLKLSIHPPGIFSSGYEY